MSLSALSEAMGWLYFAAWSISFYPQVWLNYTRKSVSGLSFEYQAYNITGFTFYAVYCIVNYIMQHRYNLTKSIEANDIAFSVHAVIITLIIIYQCVIYKLKTQKLNIWHLYVISIMWILLFYNIILCANKILDWYATSDNYTYSLMEYMGYCKVAISTIKYCPQAYMNWKRKSTVGWSIGNVLLDLTGGLLSFGQQGIDAYDKGSTSVFTTNIAKLLLAIESIAFDLLFIFQHYVLYSENNKKRVLLSREEEERIEDHNLTASLAAANSSDGSTALQMEDEHDEPHRMMMGGSQTTYIASDDTSVNHHSVPLTAASTSTSIAHNGANNNHGGSSADQYTALLPH